MRPLYQVADVLQQAGGRIECIGLNTHQLRTLRAIESCRTPALGGHIDNTTNRVFAKAGK